MSDIPFYRFDDPSGHINLCPSWWAPLTLDWDYRVFKRYRTDKKTTERNGRETSLKKMTVDMAALCAMFSISQRYRGVTTTTVRLPDTWLAALMWGPVKNWRNNWHKVICRSVKTVSGIGDSPLCNNRCPLYRTSCKNHSHFVVDLISAGMVGKVKDAMSMRHVLESDMESDMSIYSRLDGSKVDVEEETAVVDEFDTRYLGRVAPHSISTCKDRLNYCIRSQSGARQMSSRDRDDNHIWDRIYETRGEEVLQLMKTTSNLSSRLSRRERYCSGISTTPVAIRLLVRAPASKIKSSYVDPMACMIDMVYSGARDKKRGTVTTSLRREGLPHTVKTASSQCRCSPEVFLETMNYMQQIGMTMSVGQVRSDGTTEECCPADIKDENQRFNIVAPINFYEKWSSVLLHRMGYEHVPEIKKDE